MEIDKNKANRLADWLLGTGFGAFVLVCMTFGLSSLPVLVVLLAFLSVFYAPVAIIVGFSIKILCEFRK